MGKEEKDEEESSVRSRNARSLTPSGAVMTGRKNIRISGPRSQSGAGSEGSRRWQNAGIRMMMRGRRRRMSVMVSVTSVHLVRGRGIRICC